MLMQFLKTIPSGVAVIPVSVLVLALLMLPVWVVHRKKLHDRYLYSLGYFLVVIWLLRFLVGILTEYGRESGLSPLEQVFDSMVHALQTFGMDEDYAAFTVAGKEYLTGLGYPFWAEVYGLVNSALNLLAPVVGGALLLDILAGFFPSLKLKCMSRRDKFVFSALSEKAVTLAEDMAKHRELLVGFSGKRKFKPLFVFADADLDRSAEAGADLLERARELGAVCIKYDPAHLKIGRSSSVSYFLINDDSHENISMLSQLLDRGIGTEAYWPAADDPEKIRTRIYVFGQNDTDFTLTKQLCATHQAAEKVMVRPVPDLMNMAFNLMYEAPLFLPLLRGSERRELWVTILGDGAVAEELLKTVYWCGQMHSVQLHLTVLAKDPEELRRRIGENCPELLPSCEAKSKLLLVSHYVPDEYNPPYCNSLEFTKVCDYGLSAYTAELLKKTNYHIVALESEEENLHIAEQLRVETVRRAMEENKPPCVLIAPAVLDHRLADVALQLSPARLEPYVIPFGTLKERYSCKHVFLSNFTEATNTNNLYSKKTQSKEKDDIYKSISSTARCVHAPYKVFDLGLIRSVDLSPEAARRYEPVRAVLTLEQEDQLAWTEHRRWNAFIRSLGFKCPTKKQLDSCFAELGKPKSIPNKLHSCLVESRVTPVDLPEQENFDRTVYDNLDYVAMYVCKLEAEAKGKTPTAKDLKAQDYKVYDYREYDSAVQDILKPPQ